MNRCKHCGKEISEGKKFCNNSCAASYNNVHRGPRKPWTEEQHLKNRRKVKEVQCCHYCGQEILAGRVVCDRCKPFVQRVPTYQKLGIFGGSLASRDIKAKMVVKDLYEEGLTIADMYSQFALHNVTVREMLREQGVELRTLSEEQKRNIEKGRETSFTGIRGIHKTWQGVEIGYRSSWEDRFMSKLDEEKVEYLYEPFRIRYWDSEKQIERIAIPDFYLPKTNELIELKSSWTYRGQEQRMRDKFTSYKNLGYSPKLLLDWNFVEI